MRGLGSPDIASLILATSAVNAATFENDKRIHGLGEKLILRTLAIALLLLAANPAAADNARVKACFDLSSNAEQRDCAQALYRDASKELDEIVRRKLEAAEASDKAPPQFGTVPQEQSFHDAIAASQKAWEAYRDAECWGVVGRPGGSGSFTWGFGCAAEKTLERIEEVRVPFYQR
jgi:uncharacterized protein YecT (DUF1311 family)